MKEPLFIWRQPFDVATALTSTMASPATEDNALTAEKLLKAVKAISQPDPLHGAFAIRCSEEMAAKAELLGLPVVVSKLVPDGYIVALKSGEFGPEVALIIGPEKKSDLDASK